MIIRFAHRRFAPSLVGTILTLIGIALFIQLGTWQLRRAEQKEAVHASYEAGRQSTVRLTPQNLESLPRFQQVSAEGRYLSDRQILLDNMPSASGWPGYRVLTPFALSFGEQVLVDRGWIPMGNRVELPQVEVDGDVRVLTGRIDRLPRPGLRLRDEEGAGTRWPRVLNFPEQATIERALGAKVASHIVLLDASEPDGFERVWESRLPVGSERHVGYAVQWFAFALVAMIIYVVLGFKRGQDSNDGT